MNRKETLDAADICVNGQREHDYGAPEDNFATIAAMWTTYVRRSCHSMNITITAHDVTVMMSLLKIGRIAGGQTKDDNYIDACGYMACAAELATEKSEPKAELKWDHTDSTIIGKAEALGNGCFKIYKD